MTLTYCNFGFSDIITFKCIGGPNHYLMIVDTDKQTLIQNFTWLNEIEENEVEEPYTSKPFQINNISGPALRIYPQNQTAKTGDIIDVYLYFDDVPLDKAVTGIHVDIVINATELAFITESFEQGQLVTQFSGVTIWPKPRYSEDGNTMSIDGAVFSDANGLFGTGSIAKFGLQVLAGSGTLNINIAEV